MTMEKTKFYSPIQAATGSLFGPLAAVYFINNNFEAMNKKEASKKTILFGSIITILLILISLYLPDNFPSIALTIPIIFTTKFIVEKYQYTKEAITENENLEFHSEWRLFFISLACLAIYFVLAFALLIPLNMLGLTNVT